MNHIISYKLFEQRKKTFPVDPNVLKPLNNYNKEILTKTNQTIVKKLQSVKLELPEGYANPTNPNFLSRVSQWLESKGITPYININTNDYGNDESLSLGVSWTIPKTDVSVNLQNGYFGIDIPLPKGIGLLLGYQPGESEEVVGGWKSKVGGSMIQNSKVGATISIPIGK